MAKKVAKKKALPPTIYVYQPDDAITQDYLLAETEIDTIADGQEIGVYELVSVKRKTVVHSLA